MLNSLTLFTSSVVPTRQRHCGYSSSTSSKLALQRHNTQGAVALRAAFPAIIYAVTPRNDGMLIRTSAKALRAVSLQLRHKTYFQFRSLIDVAVVDRLRAPARFSINYLFLSVTTNQRAIVQLFADETSTIPSLAVPYANGQRYFASAGWLEREAWDMFGVYFSEHGDLRRILTDYGFTGHPLRKDFPLTGFHELVYNDAQGRVVSTHVELSQEFRVFSYA